VPAQVYDDDDDVYYGNRRKTWSEIAMNLVLEDLVLFVIKQLSLDIGSSMLNTIQQTLITTSFRPKGVVPGLQVSTSRWVINYISRGLQPPHHLSHHSRAENPLGK
jgi:hypothetical protein